MQADDFMTFDLGSFDFNDLSDLSSQVTDLVDTSGKPAPTQAFLITADGYRIVADIVYDGIDEASGDRCYALKVETDWLDLRLAAIEIDRIPPDVRIMFKQPGNFNPNDRRRLTETLSAIQWIVGGQRESTIRSNQ
jgi:hypothetical protein